MAAYEAYGKGEESECGTPVMGVDGVVVSSFVVSVHRGGWEGTQAGMGVAGKGVANYSHIGTVLGVMLVLALFFGRRYWKSFRKAPGGDEKEKFESEMVKLKRSGTNLTMGAYI
ncbi:hypothetical protein TrRE_jg10736 [Triparma retinervis]|uniref:Uncharacterized protein n=1 Tax=Triparma retinervis TaxID=2557542 RepID=A0A9W7F702_9STRA|nr:hypothetical protein TrRE_jg10736 [Triparma retinervis]